MHAHVRRFLGMRLCQRGTYGDPEVVECENIIHIYPRSSVNWNQNPVNWYSIPVYIIQSTAKNIQLFSS
mgnify:CR=1 FL=1